ncbi:MAG: hypothetical protein L0Y38_08105 [Methylococcaceae bacterium]|nr:hypothetical protein [Methylococcaceae bacterium]
MALIDGDRFEGRFRDGVHSVDVSDLMCRMVKEELLTFDSKPLFPGRRAYTVPYRLSDLEARLYRADVLWNHKRAGTVGFALTIVQRRLASSPEAIFDFLRRLETLAQQVRKSGADKKREELSQLLQNQAGKPNARLDFNEAGKRGGALVLSLGLLAKPKLVLSLFSEFLEWSTRPC